MSADDRPAAVRYRADHLVTMEGPGAPTVHTPGAVDVAAGRVTWSGPAAAVPAGAGAPVTEVPVPGLLLPGLVDIHAHTPMLLLRGTGEGLPTDRWLTEVMWPREARLEPGDVEAAMRYGATELLRGGITTSSEMYFHGAAVARGAAAAGLRCVVASPLIEAADFSGFGSLEDQLDAIAGLRQEWVGHPTIEVGVGPHAAYSLSARALGAVAELVSGDPMLVHIHVAEQRGEAAAVEAATGMTVPRYLDGLGLLTGRTVAAHCVWVTDHDVALLAARGVGVAHCPVSNGRHASGIAPVGELRRAGVAVGVATDGPASHDRLDLFEEARTAIRVARLRDLDASALDAATALAMVTREAADALGRPDLGRLTAGARADMIALDVGADGFAPVLSDGDLIGRIVWAGHPGAVRSVWVEGELVVADGDCLRVDRDEARRHAVAAARRLAAG